MAQGHDRQDNPSIRWSKAGMRSVAPESTSDGPADRTRAGRVLASALSAAARASGVPEPSDDGRAHADEPNSTIALILLGTNAWATSVGWTLLPADVRFRDALFGASALLWLLLGAVLHLRRNSEPAQTATRWLLLCVYPSSLAAALCVGSEAARERVHSPLSMLFCALSLLAYLVVAVNAARSPLPLVAAVTHTRRRERASTPGSNPLRNAVIVIALGGALAIGLFAPLLPAYSEVEAAWGEASEAGAVLSAVVGGALAVSIVAIYLGAILHPRPIERSTARQRRQ
ncbi:MAG TPA: hypothetical protein VHZ95_01105, partial [Polyangiales bacterium]|nr:hypothetical protein [Polyangiales bacterium]